MEEITREQNYTLIQEQGEDYFNKAESKEGFIYRLVVYETIPDDEDLVVIYKIKGKEVWFIDTLYEVIEMYDVDQVDDFIFNYICSL